MTKIELEKYVEDLAKSYREDERRNQDFMVKVLCDNRAVVAEHILEKIKQL